MEFPKEIGGGTEQIFEEWQNFPKFDGSYKDADRSMGVFHPQLSGLNLMVTAQNPSETELSQSFRQFT